MKIAAFETIIFDFGGTVFEPYYLSFLHFIKIKYQELKKILGKISL